MGLLRALPSGDHVLYSTLSVEAVGRWTTQKSCPGPQLPDHAGERKEGTTRTVGVIPEGQYSIPQLVLLLLRDVRSAELHQCHYSNVFDRRLPRRCVQHLRSGCAQVHWNGSRDPSGPDDRGLSPNDQVYFPPIWFVRWCPTSRRPLHSSAQYCQRKNLYILMVLVRLSGHHFGHYFDIPFGNHILPALALRDIEIAGPTHRQIPFAYRHGCGQDWRLVPLVS